MSSNTEIGKLEHALREADNDHVACRVSEILLIIDSLLSRCRLAIAVDCMCIHWGQMCVLFIYMRIYGRGVVCEAGVRQRAYIALGDAYYSIGELTTAKKDYYQHVRDSPPE